MQQVIERAGRPIEKKGNGPKNPMNEGPMRKQVRILVVDDCHSLRRTIALLIRSAGHTAIEAINGAEAIEIAKREKVDMIITDFNMPVMGGEDLILHMKRIDPTIPIAVVTANEDRDVEPRLLGIGACKVIKKPFTSEDIQGVIERNV